VESKCPAPEGFLLSRIRWDYFVTLTHSTVGTGRWSNPSARRQQHRWSNWCRSVCRKLKIHSNSFRWVRRWEVGRGGREHFHALVNFHKHSLVHKTTMYQLKGIWEQKQYGIADVRACESTGVTAYITKLQNEYEMNRFGADRFRHVLFGKSTLKAMRRQLEGVSVHTGY
jgi:transposase-like protein